MSHSYSSALVHVVFSTKDRQPIIDDPEKLWAYVIGIERNIGLHPIATGGINNHLHLLFAFPGTIAFSEAIQKIKANSSRWMKDRVRGFSWQEGFGAFTVSPSHVQAVTRYVRNQEQHHRKTGFEDEFIAMLKKAGIQYDPKHVFG